MTQTVAATAAPRGDSVADAAAAAVGYLRGIQDPDGWWKGDLETNVTMDAEDLLLRQFLGVADPVLTQAAARFIRGQQREDGTRAAFYGRPGRLSTTLHAYLAPRPRRAPPPRAALGP